MLVVTLVCIAYNLKCEIVPFIGIACSQAKAAAEQRVLFFISKTHLIYNNAQRYTTHSLVSARVLRALAYSARIVASRLRRNGQESVVVVVVVVEFYLRV